MFRFLVLAAFVVQVISDCSRNNCKNGATCVPQDIGYLWSYSCQCAPGYYGAQCQWDDLERCLPNTITPCVNGGNCTDINARERLCKCPTTSLTWIRYGGHYCEIDNPCSNCPTNTRFCRPNPFNRMGRSCLDASWTVIYNSDGSLA